MSEQKKIAGYKHILLGWIITALTLGTFLLWGSFAPLDKGAMIEGQVIVSGRKKQIQAPQSGVLAQLLVQNGQWVEKNQILVILDNRVAKSQLEAATTQYYMALAEKERLIAEFTEAAKLRYSSKLTETALPQAVEAMRLNQQLFVQRKATLDAELLLLENNKHTTLSRITGLQSVVASQQQQLDIYKNWLKDTQALVDKGYQSQEKLYQLQAQAAEISADSANSQAELKAQQARLLEQDTQLQQTIKAYKQDVSQQMAANQTNISHFKQLIIAAQFSFDNSEVRAPAAGQVVGLNAFGDVVSQSQQLMEIMPKGQSLIVDAKVPVHLIDSILLGQEVDLLFNAFNTSTTPKVKGNIDSLTQDIVNDQRTGQPYYQVTIRVNEQALLKELVLQPGMPVQAFVKNGERSMLSYLFKPLIDRIPHAMADN
ncbi:HlyD family type I secretion periplasmic adaptor subunit [Pseudoalteromonas prydzensis]|uniref:Membrane fusion protein (MFP) family protein n=1 Tax=Pseudoalteromonas prydzensis TaxID=182141 RepID=A0ABR9FR86_9GAMM|nr:HlyD family type I secretion periplasmic adaptor subunit [Pseudoalteromonas prydzensis]MBE0459350.1 HlyD family type I secretion periplasmic adaptor subunit [Pseudoalteromonas prydzensis]